ncbi:MAG: ABC transporter permease [Gemmatimonadaceae bacterium]|nr:ABC transporter permease [Gemmatimonadaceae bacterium]MCC6432340.1 ABC transporter permease [Gemmatimonadaceae bacterium]
MGKLMAVIRREYLERVRSRWFVIATVFGPVLIGALMFLPALISSRDKGSADASKIVIVDATGAGLGERVAARLSGGISGGGGATPRVETVLADGVAQAESLATKDVMSEAMKGYLVLDSTTLAGQKARYAGSNTSALFDMQKLERAVQREVLSLRMEKTGIDPDVGRQLMEINVNVSTERLTKQGRGGSGQLNFFFGLAVAMLLYMTIFIYGLNVLRGVLEEKQSRVAEVVISSLPASRLLAGKVIGVGGVGLTQMVIWMSMSFLMYKIRAPILAKFGAASAPMGIPDISWGTGLVLIAFFVLGFMLYAGLFAAVGATVNSEQEAQQAQMPVVLLLVSSIMFAQNILLTPDGTLSRVLSMLPFSAPIVMPLRMTVAPVPPSEIAIALASVALGALAAVWLASRIYRVGLLMYGKRPSIGEVLKWVRQR